MKYFRASYVVGLPSFAVGWYFFFVSVHLLLNSEASLTRILIGATLGMVGILIGGYIMSPVIADSIAEKVIIRVRPFLDYIPGGRRRTDPPAAPPNEPPGIG